MAGYIICSLLLTNLLVFLLPPFCWTFLIAVKPETELISSTVTCWAQNAMFASYTLLFRHFDFFKANGNSVLVAGITTIVSLAVSVMAAYAFSRFRLKGRKVMMIMFYTEGKVAPTHWFDDEESKKPKVSTWDGTS